MSVPNSIRSGQSMASWPTRMYLLATLTLTVQPPPPLLLQYFVLLAPGENQTGVEHKVSEGQVQLGPVSLVSVHGTQVGHIIALGHERVARRNGPQSHPLPFRGPESCSYDR